MSSGERVSQAFHFRTNDYPERDRIEALCEIYGRIIIKQDVVTARDRALHLEASLLTLPGFALGFVTCSGISRFPRTARHIDNDDLVLNVSLRGGRHLLQRGCEIAVARGEAVVASAAEPGVVTLPPAVRYVSIRLPRKAMAALIVERDIDVPKLIRRDSEALQLLLEYVRTLRNRSAFSSPELQRPVAQHVYDLAALAIGATRDATEIADSRGLRAARLRAIKADIAEHIGQGDLSLAEVAGRHRLSPRSVQLMFEADGTTFTDFVLGERLARAHEMLVSPRFAGRTISAIAFDVGFGDLSYFNRTFRCRFGCTPSEVRATTSAPHRIADLGSPV
jgi:AraC-like DNA-binding protein